MMNLLRLKNYLYEHLRNGVALAFSGGVDSSLLLAVLQQLPVQMPLSVVMISSVLQTPTEIANAVATAQALGKELTIIASDLLALAAVKYNSPQRCYVCKRQIFGEIKKYAAAKNLATVIDGTNADDLHSWRPGLKALRELDIKSPLADLGINKATVRQMLAALNLPVTARLGVERLGAQRLGVERPSAPCLATRFTYGTELTPEKLTAVARGEEFLRPFLPATADLRLRVHGDWARIETTKNFITELAANAAVIVPTLQALGFKTITLDLAGFRSGSMDGDTNNIKLS